MTELKTLKDIDYSLCTSCIDDLKVEAIKWIKELETEDRSIYRHPDYNFMIELKAEAIKWINNCLKCGNKELFLNQRIYCHACIRFKHFFNISDEELK